MVLFMGKSSLSDRFSYKLLSPDAVCPTQATPGSAAFDVYSPYELCVDPFTTIRVPLDICIIPPKNCYIRTAGRSSLALNHGIFCPADVIDPDYTGPIHMILSNLSFKQYKISRHERIGGIVFERYAVPVPNRVDGFEVTGRGSRGFGSTGKF